MGLTALTSGALKHLIINGVDVGRTMSEFMIERNTSGYLRVNTQQTRGTVDIEENAGTSFLCGTTLAESTLKNFAHAIGVSPDALVSNSGKKLNLAEAGTLRKVSIEGLGPGPYGRHRYFKFPRAASISTGSLVTWAQDTQSGIPIQFEALQDPFVGSWGEFYDFKPFFKDQPAASDGSSALFRKIFEIAKAADWKTIAGSTDAGVLPDADDETDKTGALTYSVEVVDQNGVTGLDNIGDGDIGFAPGTRILAGAPDPNLAVGSEYDITYKVTDAAGKFSTVLFKIRIK